MKYSDIKYFDIANGDGIRTSLFVSGCTNYCKGCFNSKTWDFDFGEEFTDSTIDTIIESIKSPFIKGLSILGGDPMHPRNQKDVFKLVERLKEELPSKDIWMWTGYTLESDLLNVNSTFHTEFTNRILDNIDVLVDGKFIESLKVIGQYRGSSNQRIIKKPLK